MECFKWVESKSRIISSLIVIALSFSVTLPILLYMSSLAYEYLVE